MLDQRTHIAKHTKAMLWIIAALILVMTLVEGLT